MSNKASLALCLLMTICVVQVFSGCTDKLTNCKKYGKYACINKYVTWGKANCKKFCGFCGDDEKKKEEDKPCKVHGGTYAIGEAFQVECKKCTCFDKDGIYSCKYLKCPAKFDLPKGCFWVDSVEDCCYEPACVEKHEKVVYPAGWKKVHKRFGDL